MRADYAAVSTTTQSEIPPEVMALLDGRDLAGRDAMAFVLMTTGEHGWPHAALLSVGEVLARSPSDVALALHRTSGTTANLARTGRATLLVVAPPAAYTIRLDARPAPAAGDGPLARFSAGVAAVIRHEAPYAQLTAPIGFRLADPDAVHARWAATLDTLRAPDDAGSGASSA
jgi:hypothetical protein